MKTRILYALHRRPIRAVEGVTLLAGGAATVAGDLLAAAVAAVAVIGGEIAQRHTTSYRYPVFVDHDDAEPGDL